MAGASKMEKLDKWLHPKMWMHDDGSHYLVHLMTAMFCLGIMWIAYTASLSKVTDILV